MRERKFSLLLSAAACLFAVEAGALAVCIGLMVLDSGPIASFEGALMWVFAQPVIIPIALGSLPLAVLLRLVLGLVFKQPRPTALISGGAVGLLGSTLFASVSKDVLSALVPAIPLGLVAGLVGGWTWWQIEKEFLDRPKLSDSQEG